MPQFTHEAATFILAAVQCLGILSTVAVRLGEGSPYQASYQRIYLVCLLMVGASMFSALSLGPGKCMACGAVLSSMVLGVVWDLRPSRAM